MLLFNTGVCGDWLSILAPGSTVLPVCRLVTDTQVHPSSSHVNLTSVNLFFFHRFCVCAATAFQITFQNCLFCSTNMFDAHFTQNFKKRETRGSTCICTSISSHQSLANMHTLTFSSSYVTADILKIKWSSSVNGKKHLELLTSATTKWSQNIQWAQQTVSTRDIAPTWYFSSKLMINLSKGVVFSF